MNLSQLKEQVRNILRERSVKAIQKEYSSVVDDIQKHLELYKKSKGTPEEKKHVGHLKVLGEKKKKLSAELDKAVAGLYKNAELKVDEAITNPKKSNPNDLATTVIGWYDFATDYIDDGGQRRRAEKSNDDVVKWFDSHPSDVKQKAFKVMLSKQPSIKSKIERVFGSKLKEGKSINEFMTPRDIDSKMKELGIKKIPISSQGERVLKGMVKEKFLDKVTNSERLIYFVESLGNEKFGYRSKGKPLSPLVDRFWNDITSEAIFFGGKLAAYQVAMNIKDMKRNGEQLDSPYQMMKEYFKNFGMEHDRSRVFDSAIRNLEEWMKRNKIKESVINEDTRRVKLLGIDFKVSEMNGRIFFSFVDKKAASVQLRQVGTNKIVNLIQKSLDNAYGKGEFFFKGGDHAEFQNGYLFQRSIGNINLNKLKFESVNEGSKVYFEKELKNGKIFQVIDRDTTGMRGTQDKFRMQIVDKSGKVIKDLGSHPSIKGAEKFGDKFESVNEASEPEIISQLKDIVKNKQYQSVKDPKSGKSVKVDIQTANAVLQIYNGLSNVNKDNMVKMGLPKMIEVSYKIISKYR
jgi:hypothetical protein